MEHEGDGDTIYNWGTWNDFQRIGKGTGKIGNQRTSKDYPDYIITKIGQNTEKSPGDLRRFTVTNVGVKNFQRKILIN